MENVKYSFEEAKSRIENEVKVFNEKIVSIARNCQDPLYLRPLNAHNIDFSGDIDNPVQLFINKPPKGLGNKFTYNDI